MQCHAPNVGDGLLAYTLSQVDLYDRQKMRATTPGTSLVEHNKNLLIDFLIHLARSSQLVRLLRYGYAGKPFTCNHYAGLSLLALAHANNHHKICVTKLALH